MKIIIMILVFQCCVLSLQCSTFYINQDGTGDFTEIQSAIDYATNCDRLSVAPGTYYENLDFHGKYLILGSYYYETHDNWYINNTIIDGNNTGAVISFSSHENEMCRVNGFTLRNGSGHPSNNHYGNTDGVGGGIYIRESSPTLENLIIENNNAYCGGGIFCTSSQSCWYNLTIRDNYAQFCGGGIFFLAGGSANEIVFDPDRRCNIYFNQAPNGHDIGIPWYEEGPQYLIVDTLTVFDYDYSYAPTDTALLNLEVLHGKIELIDHDLYISPTGDNANSGLTADDPMKNLEYALYMIKADPEQAKYVYLAPGIYSPSMTGERYAVNCKSGVSIIGSGVENTILDAEQSGSLCHLCGDRNIAIRNLTIKNGFGMFTGFLTATASSSLIMENLNIQNCRSLSTGAFNLCFSSLLANNIIINNCEGFNMINGCGLMEEHELVLSNIAITNCGAFSDVPEEEMDGGVAIMLNSCASAQIVNCLLTENRSCSDIFPRASVICDKSENVSIINCTIVDNETTFGGGFFLGNRTNAFIINSIIFNNGDFTFIHENSIPPSQLYVEFSVLDDPIEWLNMVSPGYSTEVYLDESIILGNPGLLGYGDIYTRNHLNPLSSCIDAGNPDTSGFSLPSYDFLGKPRFNGECVDIGCFEYFPVLTEDEIIPAKDFSLSCYPNPVILKKTDRGINSMVINASFTMNEESLKKKKIIEIYNLKGQLVNRINLQAILMDERTKKGGSNYTATWNLRDINRRTVAAGTYLIVARINNKIVSQKKCLLLK